MTKPPADVNYTFDSAQLDQLSAYGDIRHHKPGDLLIEEGQSRCDCLVTLSGHTNIFISTPEGERRMGWMERGQFAGDITVLTGPVIIRTVLLNGLLGTLYGWLYWRRGLEAGIMAHMASHVGFWAVLGLVG